MIRKVILSDVFAITKLNAYCLGYEYGISEAEIKLERLISDKNHLILVYVENNELKGYCHASLYDTLYFDTLYNVLGLAAMPNDQGQGIGRLLLEELEKIAKEKGIAGIRINSGISRHSAHNFYIHQGYIQKDDQKRFIKFLR